MRLPPCYRLVLLAALGPAVGCSILFDDSDHHTLFRPDAAQGGRDGRALDAATSVDAPPPRADAHASMDAHRRDASSEEREATFVQASQIVGGMAGAAPTMLSANLVNAVSVGDLLVAFVAVQSTSPGLVTVTDTDSTGAWTSTQPLSCADYTVILYTTATKPGPDVISVTLTPRPDAGSDRIMVVAAEYSGLPAHPTLDAVLSSGCVSPSGDAGLVESQPVTTHGPDLLVAGLVDFLGGGSAISVGSPWHIVASEVHYVFVDSTGGGIGRAAGMFRIGETGDGPEFVNATVAAFRLE